MAIADAALHAILARYRRSQLATGASTSALVLELGREWSAGRLSRDEFEVALIAAEKLGFNASSGVAAAHLAEIRAAQDADGITELADFDLRAAAARAEATVAALDRVSDAPELQQRIIQTAAVWADRGAKMGGRRTVERSAAASGRRWRRVPDGDPCTWCGMLATRGYLDDGYASQEAALWTNAGKKYHDFCGCVATEIVDDWVPDKFEARWIDTYETASSHVLAQGRPLSPEMVLARMREVGDFNDSPSRTRQGHALVPLPPAARGRVTEHPSAKPLHHEVDTANRLAVVGISVYMRERVEDDGIKNPDYLIDGKIWEAKSPTGSGKHTISNQFSRAGHQSDRTVLDLTRTPIPDDEALKEIRARLSRHKRLVEAMVILKTGEVRRFAK